MIIEENLVINERQFVKRYSDAGMKIQRQDGVMFEDAVDPADSGRTYTETNIQIEDGTAEEVLNVLLGGAE